MASAGLDVEEAWRRPPAAGSRLRVHADDPEYVRLCAEEATSWSSERPFSLECQAQQGPPERHTNRRFTGDPRVPWYQTQQRHGQFRSGAALGSSNKRCRACREPVVSSRWCMVCNQPLG